MSQKSFSDMLSEKPIQDDIDFHLNDGSNVAVMGGGPAGSLFAYYLLDIAERIDLELSVDIYEPRDFFTPSPKACNMCGGIISETLVQNLASDGINLPETVIQRGLDSYILHTDIGSVKIQTPLREKRIGAVHRGPGPRDIKEIKWEGFDGFLLNLTKEKGANVIPERVTDVSMEAGKPTLHTRKGEPITYDLLGVAVGINTQALRIFEKMNFGFTPPVGTKTHICEYYIGQEKIDKTLGNSMHVFLLNVPRLKFAAIIPKGDYVTFCMLGEDIDSKMVSSFINSDAVVNCMPKGWIPSPNSCQCAPRINVKGADPPFSNRMVFLGDSGVTRLYKDGIGAAYRTAKAAANTAVLHGIAAEDFEQHFWPVCQNIKTDNQIGKISFLMTELIRKIGFARAGLVRMTSDEQVNNKPPRMSMVMWDMFTGSAPYKEIFIRTLQPAFLIRFCWDMLMSIFPSKNNKNN